MDNLATETCGRAQTEMQLEAASLFLLLGRNAAFRSGLLAAN